MWKAACVFGGALLIACATGGSAGTDANGKPQDATAVHLDGHNVAPGDGPITTPHDAAMPPHPVDAFVPQDADQGGEFCSDNTGCGSTTCCFVAICVPGTGIGSDLCFPSD